MAVVNTIATTIADEVTLEPWKNSGACALPEFVTSGLVSVAAADDDTSTYRLARLPSGARVTSIKLFTAGIAGGTSYDFGLFAAGGAVKSVACYAAAVDLSSAKVGTEIAFQARSLANHRKHVWEDAGDGSDGGSQYDLVATANTVGTGAGTIMAIVGYVLV